jgi:Macrocin-O-methyltransferase (TylF)
MITPDILIQLLKHSESFYTRQHIWHKFLSFMNQKDVCLEFGVNFGKSINYMADVRPKNTFIGFDSFDGLPEDWTRTAKKGRFKTDFSKLKFNKNVKIEKGMFDTNLPVFLKTNSKHLHRIHLLHIDCDLYSSTSTVLSLLEDTIIKNKPYILFDEFYNYNEYLDHEFRAFLEFVNKVNCQFHIVGRNIKHQQVLIKIT